MDLYRAAVATGRAKDNEPVFPYRRQYLFEAFWDLHQVRGSNGFGPSPISYHDIDTYCRVLDVKLTPWDVRMIRQMDSVMMKANRVSDARTAAAAANKGKR